MLSRQDNKPVPQTALVLSGGGARAAYQVGVMRGIARILNDDRPNPFRIISGTSAGALNATGLATHAHKLKTSVRMLEYVWENITIDRVYRLDSSGLLSSASNWVFSFLANRGRKMAPSLLDNRPLQELLSSVLKLERVGENMSLGYLDSLVVNASGYSSGESVSFFQSTKEVDNWSRPHRIGIRTELRHQHLMASTAIPSLFPAIKINREYFGDGAIRQLAPLSPAIHLGAEKILAIGVSGSRRKHPAKDEDVAQPSLSQILGHILNSAFVDSLEHDIATLQRHNALLAQCRGKPAHDIRPIDLLSITPSEDPNHIADAHYHRLPKSIRLFLRDTNSNSLASLLMFDHHYCSDLMKLGIADAQAKREQVLKFFNE
ncbi:patatin-like phospholipase family protein [Pseudohongiella nitratireducens]|nr:patatin-like phospholipase family protein [Pseudohongiella nitratireducens]